MTEKQFKIFCKVIYCLTVATLILQIMVCSFTFWMSWHGLPRLQDVLMLLGVSVFGSWVHLKSKKSFFKRNEVCSGLYGTTGIMHSLGVNLFWWCSYHFMELVFLIPAFKICVQEIFFEL